MAVSRQLYFILHLQETDLRAPDLCYEIQILNHDGRAIHFCCLGQSTQELEIDGIPIPISVVQAAKRLPIGKGEYVDETGVSAPPF